MISTQLVIIHDYRHLICSCICNEPRPNYSYSLAKDGDVDEILNYVELVLGAVVMCPNKAKFIENIFKLDSATQKILQVYIQRVMSSAVDVAADSEAPHADTGSGNSSTASEDVIRAQEMIKHLNNERNKLLDTIAAVEAKHAELHEEHR